MEELLRGLVLDLERRCQVLQQRLAGISGEGEVNDYAISAYVELAHTLRDVRRLLADPSLGVPELQPDYLRSYRRLHEYTQLIESYHLPILERYNDVDRRATRFCRALAEQAGWPILVPLVSASSTSYYWTVPDFNIIGVPSAEMSTLLGLPDFGHELGHTLMHARSNQLIGDFVYKELLEYIEVAQQRAKAQERPPEHLALYNALFGQWEAEWVIEFASDMIATYLIGSGFAWQHLRLCAAVGGNDYHPAFGEWAVHPADEARMRGVLMVLTLMEEDSSTLQERWDAYLEMSGEPPPAEYSICYPQELIERLAARVVTGCQALGVKSFKEQGSDSIAPLLNEAWRRFLSAPDGYTVWEKEQLAKLWRELGFDDAKLKSLECLHFPGDRHSRP